MKPTDEQTAILDAVKGSKQSLMIRARAGTGKTTMLQMIDAAEKAQPYLLMCFNKAIATEAEKRMRSATTVRTFNSLGHKIWAAAVDRRLTLNKKKIAEIFRSIVDEASRGERAYLWSMYDSVLAATSIARNIGYIPPTHARASKSLCDFRAVERLLDETLLPDAPALIDACRERGWQILLLSGDSSPMVAQVAAELGITDARSGLTPADKLAALQQLHSQGRRVLMLGDGVNDVPVLAAADISVAMGSATDLAKTSADAVLLSNRLDSLVQAFTLARRTRRIIVENLAWACLYNGLILPFAALGWVTPIWAALGMSLSSLLVVLNALRLTRTPAAPLAHSPAQTA